MSSSLWPSMRYRTQCFGFDSNLHPSAFRVGRIFLLCPETSFGDEGFRGVVILRAPSLDSALSLSYLLKLNPGGSVASAQLPSGLHEELLQTENRSSSNDGRSARS